MLIALLLTGIALCLVPVVLVWRASAFAARHGCILHEGFANPCIVDGVDHGSRLYAWFVSGWFMLVTLPAAAILLAVLVAVVAVPPLLRWVRRRR